jgi:N-acetylmuramoyl-L-alanine amidase
VFLTVNLKRIISCTLAFLLILAVAVIGIFGDPGDPYAVPVICTQSAEAGVLVIDAGHGGEDGGAQSASGTLESAVNLDIARKLQALAEFCGVQTVMTRATDEIVYPDSATTTSQRKTWDQKTRVELINSVSQAVLISIHQNKYPHASPRGSQVLYAKTAGSQELGELTHTNLTAALYPENRRVAAPISDTIYLTKMVTCPAILVECGFLSNPEEAALLETPEYRLKIAVVLLGSYLEYQYMDTAQ